MAKKKSTKKAAKKSTKKTAKKKSVAKAPVTKKKTSKKKTVKKAAKKAVKKTTKKTTKKAAKKVTKKSTRKKAPSKSAASQETEVLEPIKKFKTKLGKRDIKHYKELLLKKRSVLVGDMDSMRREALADSSNLSHMPLHMADVGSDMFEQEQTLGLVEADRKVLKEIDAALERIADGSYGMCEISGVQIPKARLEAKPWARYSIEVAREREGGSRLRSRRPRKRA